MANNSIGLVKPKSPATPAFGDVLFGGEWLSAFIPSKRLRGLTLLPLSRFSVDAWGVLSSLGVANAQEAAVSTLYECPWTSNSYFWWYPVGIVILKNDVYTLRHPTASPSDVSRALVVKGRRASAFDIADSMFRNPESIAQVMLGHGYTSGTLPCDGSGSLQLATVELTTGDDLLVHCWVWHNK